MAIMNKVLLFLHVQCRKHVAKTYMCYGPYALAPSTSGNPRLHVLPVLTSQICDTCTCLGYEMSQLI